MTPSEHTKSPEGQERQALVPAPSQVLVLLERLADAPISMGLSQEQARAMFFVAPDIVRQSLAGPRPEKRRRFSKRVKSFRR